MIKVCTVALTLFAMAGAQASAGDEAEAHIRAALMRWTAAFNARDTGAVCDLFSPELRYDFRGARERGYDDICELLGRSLTDPGTRYTYSPAIKEILVAGDLAVVRLVWTLRTRKEGASEDVATEETGMDVFRKQPDGSWKIIRYIAYD
jgi:ketosteroid isomerase-like protein